MRQKILKKMMKFKNLNNVSQNLTKNTETAKYYRSYRVDID